MELTEQTKKPTKEELLAMLKEIDENEAKERDAYEDMKAELVHTICCEALAVEKAVVKLHEFTMRELTGFREVMNQYGDLPKNSKGGFSIANEDFRVRLKIHNLGDFDERANLAEEHIRAFFERTLKATDPNTFELIMKLLERKKGKFEYARVMEILSYEDRYHDTDWKKGCKLLKESFVHTGTKMYVEYEQKQDDGAWRRINLNIAAL